MTGWNEKCDCWCLCCIFRPGWCVPHWGSLQTWGLAGVRRPVGHGSCHVWSWPLWALLTYHYLVVSWSWSTNQVSTHDLIVLQHSEVISRFCPCYWKLSVKICMPLTLKVVSPLCLYLQGKRGWGMVWCLNGRLADLWSQVISCLKMKAYICVEWMSYFPSNSASRFQLSSHCWVSDLLSCFRGKLHSWECSHLTSTVVATEIVPQLGWLIFE